MIKSKVIILSMFFSLICFSSCKTVVSKEKVVGKVGDIAYQTVNGDYVVNPEYDENIGTPIGIVFEATKKGTKIVHLKHIPESLRWCKKDAHGIYVIFNTSDDDGSKNWDVIVNAVPDALDSEGKASTNYPLFYYCDRLEEGNKKWYLPAKNELLKIYENKEIINKALSKLPEEMVVPLLDDSDYSSSSQSSAVQGAVWIVDFKYGTAKNYYSKQNVFYARAVTKL